uniref:Uncharacterized protein LOC111132521 n=1 Tax=Crassostrea virginica TaxID=6565 RepID=A0A8B8E981_CRAVI|nr:uncharacterized protein LOC111132521 [Crassostrea virginica]
MTVCRLILSLISMSTFGRSNYLYVEELVPDGAVAVNYIFIKDKVYSWQEAVEVCESIGASLMEIDSWEKYTILRRLTNSSDHWNEQDTETWLGITNSALGLGWMDCSPFNFSLFAHFKDENNIQFKTDEQCYMTKKGLDFAAERKSCESKLGAICVQPIQDNTCPLSPLLSLQLLSVATTSKTDCMSACESDVNCYAIISYSNSQCLLMGKSKPSAPNLEAHVAIRKCIKGEVKSSTDFITSFTATPDKTVTLSCSSTENVLMTATPSFVIMPTSCAITMTEYLTVNVTMTNYVIESITSTVGVPAPSSSPCNQATTYINITNQEYIREAVENITKALYLDKTTTSAYVRSKTSAPDPRPSSATMGYVGIACIVTPFAFILLIDLHSVFLQMRKKCQTCGDN